MTALFLFTAACIAAVAYLFWMLKESDRTTAAKLNAAERK